MHRFYSCALAAATVTLSPLVSVAHGQEVSRSVAGGGISVPGWTGKIDASAAKRGSTLDNAKLSREGDALHVVTGPAVAYWNPANTASGNYTVSAVSYTHLRAHETGRN